MAFLMGIISARLTWVINQNQRKDKQEDIKRHEILGKLNNFYRPFQLHLNESKLHFSLFRKSTPLDFILLDYLLNRDQEYLFMDGSTKKFELDANGRRLIENILEAGIKMTALIENNIGSLDDAVLTKNYESDPAVTRVELKESGLLMFAKGHFKLITQAYNNHIEPTELFEDLIFPRELTPNIDRRTKELEDELRNL